MRLPDDLYEDLCREARLRDIPVTYVIRYRLARLSGVQNRQTAEAGTQ